MAEGDSPTVARRRVRLAIREAREAAELTQHQVAEQMEWSLSKVIRIESGEVSIAPNDLRPLLTYLGVRDRSRVDDMLRYAKIARVRQRRSWWQEPKYRGNLTEAMRRLIEYEAEAVAIRFYQVYYMPGPLQIPEYAGALLRIFGEDLSESEIKLRTEARRQRRETLHSRLGTAKLYLLMDESVFRRTIGGRDVLAAQLQELLRLATDGSVAIRMIPFDLDAPMTNNADFYILYLGADQDEDGVLYRESGLTDEIVEGAAVARHRSRYEKVWHVATDEAATIDFMRKRIDALTAGANSGPGDD